MSGKRSIAFVEYETAQQAADAKSKLDGFGVGVGIRVKNYFLNGKINCKKIAIDY